MQHNQSMSIRAWLPFYIITPIRAWLPFYIITLVTMVILFVIADVRLP